jgi:hypothetical protein
MHGGRRSPRWGSVLGAFAAAVIGLATGVAFADDGHVEQGGAERFKPNPEVLSAPFLEYPIYGCADTVMVQGFELHAELQIFVDGNLTPSGVDTDGLDSSGQIVKVSAPFTVGQTVTAKQVKGGFSSKASNTVIVTDYQSDYPNGLPQPQINPAACLDCGAAVGVSSVIPGSNWTVYAQDPTGGGNFGPKMPIGTGVGVSYAFVTPNFKTGQCITVQAKMCTDTSQPSPDQIVKADPGTIPPPTVNPPHKGAETVNVWGPSGPSGSDWSLLDGATLTVTAVSERRPRRRSADNPRRAEGRRWASVPRCPAAALKCGQPRRYARPARTARK